MKVIVSGGGTGGHIYPALAIADGIRKNYKDSEILYVGTRGSLEEELAQNAGYDFQPVRVKGMPRRLNRKSFLAIRELLRGIGDSKRIIKSFRPDLVIGTGGYVCGPVLYVAAKMKIPTAIHEQNAFPGITNKILSRYVDMALITYEDSRKYFGKCKQTVLTGNPVREDITAIKKDDARNILGIGNKPLVLSFGGSGGQKSLNRAIMEMLPEVADGEDFKLIHITGKLHYDDFIKELSEKKVSLSENYEIMAYHHNIPLVMNAADLVITSGGAIALAEISAAGKPSILIPKAYTAENHQEYNAKVFQEKGAAVMILERELTSETLLKTIRKLIAQGDRLEEMSTESRKLGNPGATNMILEELFRLI